MNGIAVWVGGRGRQFNCEKHFVLPGSQPGPGLTEHPAVRMWQGMTDEQPHHRQEVGAEHSMARTPEPEGEQGMPCAGVAVVNDVRCSGGNSQFVTWGVASDINEAETACDL